MTKAVLAVSQFPSCVSFQARYNFRCPSGLIRIAVNYLAFQSPSQEKDRYGH